MTEEVRERVPVYHPSGGPLKTKQAFRDDADVNVLISRWRVTGQLPTAPGTPAYGDFSSGLDFHQAHNRVIQTMDAFAAQPAAVRRACRGDPAEFVAMCTDPARRGELEALGLVEPKKEKVDDQRDGARGRVEAADDAAGSRTRDAAADGAAFSGDPEKGRRDRNQALSEPHKGR